MQSIDTKKFYDLLYYGHFDQAHELAKDLTSDEIWEVLCAISADKPTILSYGYMVYLLIQSEKAEYHYIASRVLFLVLHTFEGAYASAFWHAKRALELSPEEIIYKEHLLKFYFLPYQFLEKEEAQLIAREILAIDPKNEYALQVIK